MLRERSVRLDLQPYELTDRSPGFANRTEGGHTTSARPMVGAKSRLHSLTGFVSVPALTVSAQESIFSFLRVPDLNWIANEPKVGYGTFSTRAKWRSSLSARRGLLRNCLTGPTLSETPVYNS